MVHTDIEKLLDQAIGDAMSDVPATSSEILVVDDDTSVGDALSLVFADSYTVVCATSGDQGIAKLHRGTMAVVLDVRMRVKDGFDTFLEMKKAFPDVPIIFHSAYQDVRDPYEVMNDFRPFGYIKKGDDSQLRRTLCEAVAFYREIQDSEERSRHLEEENARLAKLEAEAERASELESLDEAISSRVPADPTGD